MSRLPAGTKAAGEFAASAVVTAIGATALSLFPTLFGLPIIGALARRVLDTIVRSYLAGPAVDEVTKYALASAYAADRLAFDREFIYLKALDKQNTSPEVLEKALQNAELALEKFVSRGPVT